MSTRINVGCGSNPTDGWVNYDNSLTVRIARFRHILSLTRSLGLLSADQVRFASTAANGRVRWANACRRIPHEDASVDVVYSSHMIEHLDRERAKQFLYEARRVLVPGGIIRLAAPDLQIQVRRYLDSGDADEFVEGTYLAPQLQRSWAARARGIITGARMHSWMYDGSSLRSLVESCGFRQATVMNAGESCIPEPGFLDLREREAESVYVEAIKGDGKKGFHSTS